MKEVLIIFGCLGFGFLLGINLEVGVLSYWEQGNRVLLWVLMFLIGIQLGQVPSLYRQLKKLHWTFLFLPVGTLLGTLLGTIFLLPWTSLAWTDLFAISVSMGYFSFSSAYLATVSSVSVGAIALLTGVIREVLALSLSPVLGRWCHRTGLTVAIGSGSDMVLPLIFKYSGKERVFIALYHGLVLTVFIPFLTALFYL